MNCVNACLFVWIHLDGNTVSSIYVHAILCFGIRIRKPYISWRKLLMLGLPKLNMKYTMIITLMLGINAIYK